MRSRPIKRDWRRLTATLEGKTMTSFSKLAIAAAAVVLSSCATTHETSVRMSGDNIDSSAAWATLDLNNDGSLSLDELEQQRAMGLLQDLSAADTNHDDRVTKEEWDAWWPRMTDHYVRASTAEMPALETAQ
jgi:hypothetical protein